MNSVQQNTIIISRAAMPNSVGGALPRAPARISVYADPVPLSPEEAQRLAMLLPPGLIPIPRARRLNRDDDQKGVRLDIRV